MLQNINSSYSGSDISIFSSLMRSLEKELKRPVETTRIDRITEESTEKTIERKTVIANNDQEATAVIGNIIQNNPNKTIIYISSLDDLNSANLLKTRLIVDNEGTSEMREESGLLLDNKGKPVVLMFDFRKFNVKEIAEINQLFDKPAILQGSKILKDTEIVSITNRELFNSKSGPGPDFSRRVLDFNEFIDNENYDFNIKTDLQKLEDELVTEVAASVVNNSKDQLVIDLAYKDWQRELFGYIDITHDSNLHYQPGKLTQLLANQEVYLKDAPWDDIGFKVKFYNIIKDGFYIENGNKITLPKGISWHSFTGDQKSIQKLQQEFTWDITEINKDLLTPEKTAILNSASFYDLIKTSSIKNNKFVKHDVLKDWLKNASVLRITDRLSPRQWITLLQRLKEIDRTDIILIQDQDNSISQPTGWQFANSYAKKCKDIINKQVKIVFNNMGFISEPIKQNTNTLDIQVLPSTASNQLVIEFKDISFKKRTFDTADTDFFTALKNGTPINLYGLEHNIQIVHELESLLGQPPTLCINGNTVIFEKADITIHLPNDTIAPTRTWQVALKNTKQQIKKNMSTIKKQLISVHKMPKSLSNEMVDKTLILLNELNALPATVDLPKSELIADMPLFNKIWIQALDEQIHDKSEKLTKNHFIKAINSVVIKRYRENSETYHYAKNLVKKTFSKEKDNAIDSIGLTTWMREQKEITVELLRKNLWLLSKYIPYNKLNFKKSIFQKINESIHKTLTVTVKETIQETIQETLTTENLKRIFTVKNLLYALLKPFILIFKLIYFGIVQPVYKLLNFIFILASQILPFIDTIPFPETNFLTSKSLKELAIEDDNPGLDFVKATLVYYADEAEKAKLQENLNVTNKQLKNHANAMQKYTDCEYKTEKLLRDICYSIEFDKLDNATKDKIQKIGYQKFCHELAINITQEKLKYSGIENDKENITKIVDKHLKLIFPGEEYNEERSKVVQYILAPETIESEKQFWDYWDKRRSARLTAKIKSHPIVMIKGGAGTGKSYAVKQAAEQLGGDISFYNVRPNTKAEDLLGSFVKVTDEEDNTEKLVFQKGPLAEWAEQTDDNFKILILDEFTLSSSIWDCLRSIYDHPPYININGKHIPLTAKHRIAVTSNSDHYPGRKPNKILEQNIPDMHYLQLPQEFQKERIIAPAIDELLESINFSTDNKIRHNAVKYITDSIHKLYSQYEKHIPNYEFTPRDLNDCCSKIKTYFFNQIINEEKKQITQEMINSVVRRAMKETVSNSILPDNKWKLAAIDPWHEANFPGDDTIVDEIDQMFEDFYNKMELKNAQQNDILYQTYDLSNKLTHDLAKTVWLVSLRSHLEVKTGIPHKGKRASLIEGVAGTGKDTIVNMVTKYFQEFYNTNFNYNTITAGSKSFNKVVDRLEDLHTNGGIINISELNLLDTKSLEGYFNQLLTEIPSSMRNGSNNLQTFHLWGTINPSDEDYSGRQKFSKALLNRFSQNLIGGHSYGDLVNICKKQLNNPDYAEVIVRFHYLLTENLKKEGIKALPSLEDIKKVATLFNKQIYTNTANDETEAKHFMLTLVRHYKIYIKLANWTITDLGNIVISMKNDTSVDKNQNIAELTNWVNKTFYNKLDSIIVTRGIKTEFIANQGVFKLSEADMEKNYEEKKELITDHINYYLSPNTKSVLSTDIDNDTADIKTKNINSLADQKTTLADEHIEHLKHYIKGYATNIHTDTCSINIAHNQYIDGTLAYLDIMKRYTSYVLGGDGADDLFFANSKERKNIAQKALNELNSNDKLQNQLKLLCKQDYNRNTKSIYDFLAILAKEDNISISSYENTDILNIIMKLDSANCGIIGCMALSMNTTRRGMKSFIKIIAKGYIKAKDAIKFINNTDNLLYFSAARPYIFDACCEKLAEGKNTDNISEIIEYLMEGNTDYYDYTMINNLLLLASGKFTPRLAEKAQKILDIKYKHLLTNNTNIKLKNAKSAESIFKNQPEGLIDALSPIIDKVATDIIMTGKDLTIEHSHDPIGSLDPDRFLAGKPAFEKVNVVDSKAKDVYVIGVPNIGSKDYNNFVYYKTKNKIIDLSLIDMKNIYTDLLEKYQINATYEDIALLKSIKYKQKYMYSDDVLDKKNFHDYWSVIREIESAEYQNEFENREKEPNCNFYHVDEQLLNMMLYKEMLTKFKEIKFCINLGHSSESGSIVVKTLDEIQGLINHLNYVGRYRPLICPRAIDNQHANIVNEYETKELRKLTRDSEAAVLHHKDFIDHLKNAI